MDKNTIIIIAILIGILVIALYKLIAPVMTSEQGKRGDALFISEDDIYEQVRLSINNGNHPIAQKLAKKYLKENPSHDKLRILLARSFYDTSELSEAIEQLNILIKKFDDRDDLYIMLADAYKRTGQNNSAIDTYLEILEKKPDSLDILLPLADLYTCINHKKSALNIYKRLVNLDIKDGDKSFYCYKIANLHKDLGELDNAIEYINYALNSEKNNVSYLYLYRELCALVEDSEKEIEIMNRLLVLAPTDAYLQSDLVGTYYKNKMYAEALDVAIPALNTPNADIQTLQNFIANIYIKTNRIEEGISVLENIMQTFPESIRLNETLAYAYKLYGRYEEATTLYKKLIDWADMASAKAYNNQLSSVYCDWALHLFNMGENAKTFQKFEEAMRINPDNPDIYEGLGRVNFNLRNYNDAIRQMQKAIDLDAKNSEYYIFLADIYKETDNIYEAERMYREALFIDGINPVGHAKLGTIHLQLKNIKDALKHLEIAVKGEPKNWDYMYNLALAYELSGKNEGAVELYNKVLALYPEHKEAMKNLKMLENSK